MVCLVSSVSSGQSGLEERYLVWWQSVPAKFLGDLFFTRGFPGDSAVKNLPANAGDAHWSPGLGRSPGKTNGNLLHYSYLGNPLGREAWWARIHGVTKVGHNLAIKTTTFFTRREKNFRPKLEPCLRDHITLEYLICKKKNVLGEAKRWQLADIFVETEECEYLRASLHSLSCIDIFLKIEIYHAFKKLPCATSKSEQNRSLIRGNHKCWKQWCSLMFFGCTNVWFN